ncbi:hypothetical protein [Nodosilinea nodulosa]|uniref:hypothetical protein n=1 Tax=Nodosilinea nodulosa TaxID=416001 RepID=UPI00030B4D11|nr:hypothetical protein [Nodosilinea nodulosa]
MALLNSDHYWESVDEAYDRKVDQELEEKAFDAAALRRMVDRWGMGATLMLLAEAAPAQLKADVLQLAKTACQFQMIQAAEQWDQAKIPTEL